MALASLAAPVARAAVPADSVGIYSEEHERANSSDRLGVGTAQHAAGVGIVRQPFLWSRIETAPGVLDYAVYDDVVGSAAAAGMTVLPVILDAPPWRSTGPAVAPGDDMYPPAQAGAFAVLAGLLVQRYGPNGTFWAAQPDVPYVPIHSWQVWNEPNTAQFWATGPDPAAYTRLLRAAAGAIRAADPGRRGRHRRSAREPRRHPRRPLPRTGCTPPARAARSTRSRSIPTPATPRGRSTSCAVRAPTSTATATRSGRSGRPSSAGRARGPGSLVTTTEASQATRVRDEIVLMQRARRALRLRGFVVFRWIDKALNAGQKDSWPLNTGLLR